MSGPKDKPEQLDAETVSVFVRLSSDEATDADMAALEAWANEKPEKLDELEHLSNVWDQAADMDVDRSLFFSEEDTTSHSLWQQVTRFFRTPWMMPATGLAAAAVVVAAVSIMLGTPPSSENPSFVTVRGVTQTVNLADGSTVYLNGLSRLEVNFSETERRVDLLEGEAYFDVSHDVERAFVVTVAGAEVQAIGTAFDIDAGSQALTVTVTDGTVGITVGTAYGQYGAGTKVRIPAGSEGLEDFVVTKLVLENYEDAVSWRDGVLTFAGEPLSVALERINRQSSKRIVLGDPSLANLQIFGSFSQDNLAGFLSALETLYRIRVVESHHRIALFATQQTELKQSVPGDT